MDRKVFRDGFLKSKIDEYKYGTISAEEFCHAMKDLKKYPLLLIDRNLDRITNEMIPEICSSYLESKEPDKDRKLKFWIGLKDCAALLRGDQTFTEEREEYYRTGRERRTGEGGWLGFCHTYWSVKKRVLKEHFGIDWKSIDDRFPGLLID